MQDQMEMCNRCTSDASYFIKNENVEVHFCYGCGFTSTNQEFDEESIPELYKRRAKRQHMLPATQPNLQ